MRNIKIVFSYDGSLFFGSQAQSGKRTVQEDLEIAIQKLTGEKAKLTLAGRTDRGVHAFSQAANFQTSSSIPAERFAYALNGKLDGGITVISSEEVKTAFSARRNAKTREYLYYVFNGKHLPVMLRGRAYHVVGPLDLKKMSEAAKLIKGKHDFKNFCAAGGSHTSSIRCVHILDVAVVGDDMMKETGLPGSLIRIRVVAGSFLYKMVRFIVSTLLETGRGKMSMETVKKMVKGELNVQRTIVPSCGLYLNKVKY